jgi:hypothetical protein
MLGFDREPNVLNLHDSAELNAFLFDDEDAPVDPADIQRVEFTIQKPDGAFDYVSGVLQPDGSARLIYNDTDQAGEYTTVAQFYLTNNIVRSIRSDFSVADPFAPDVPTPEQIVAKRVWDKLEDLFDSTDGGPWMRDMTLNVFDQSKIPEFIDEAIFDINVYNPPTDFNIDKFAQPILDKPNPNLTVLVQGTTTAVIRHLMRTYTEQPLPTGGQVTYEDRRDYLQRWGTMYQIEWQHFDHLVKLWKRQFLSLGQSKILVSNKAGRLLPAPLRTRNIGRGYY